MCNLSFPDFTIITIIIIIAIIIIIIGSFFCHTRKTPFWRPKKRGPSCPNWGVGVANSGNAWKKATFFLQMSFLSCKALMITDHHDLIIWWRWPSFGQYGDNLVKMIITVPYSCPLANKQSSKQSVPTCAATFKSVSCIFIFLYLCDVQPCICIVNL